jgi:hypothetical protein
MVQGVCLELLCPVVDTVKLSEKDLHSPTLSSLVWDGTIRAGLGWASTPFGHPATNMDISIHFSEEMLTGMLDAKGDYQMRSPTLAIGSRARRS